MPHTLERMKDGLIGEEREYSREKKRRAKNGEIFAKKIGKSS